MRRSKRYRMRLVNITRPMVKLPYFMKCFLLKHYQLLPIFYGKIKIKKRVTIVFCTNMNGTDKHILSVIGHSRRERYFNNFNHNARVQYFHNKKSWVTSTIFSEWLENFDVHVGTNNKKMLLILDNAPSHISLYKFVNTRIIFFYLVPLPNYNLSMLV